MKLYVLHGHRYKEASFNEIAGAFIDALTRVNVTKDLHDKAKTVTFLAASELGAHNINSEKPLTEALLDADDE